MSRTVNRSALSLPRLALSGIAVVAGVLGSLGAAQGSALAGSPAAIHVADRDHRGDWRRDERRADRRDDRRDWRDRRSDERRYDDQRRYRDDSYGRNAPRYRPAPPPRHWVPPRSYYSYYDYRHHDRWPTGASRTAAAIATGTTAATSTWSPGVPRWS